MPFVGGDDHTGRKRRWHEEDEHDQQVLELYASDNPNDIYLLNQHQALAPRKIIPLSKRARIAAADDDDIASPVSSHRRRRSSQLRPPFEQATSGSSNNNNNKVLPTKVTSNLLAPCHICHRKPTKKSDLDSFAECLGCGGRTCFVCIRYCQGWNPEDESVLSEQEVLSRSFHMDDADDEGPHHHHHHHDSKDETRRGWVAGGHRPVVCSRCCIERGTEGDVACLGCLPRMEGS